ncbi:MAG: M14 family zinc carboxypeptidase, partial [Planctomycetota bacterium]
MTSWLALLAGGHGFLTMGPLRSDDAFVVELANPEIPTPESVIGHAVGETAVRYDPLLRYLTALDEASPRIVLTEYGESYEGRKLLHLIITSEANHQRLEQIRADNVKLTDPRRLANDAEAERIVAEMPAVAWMAYSIHGDELSPTDAAMQAAYRLAAGTDAATKALLDELVIHIIPLQNPDGRERHLSSIEQRTGAVSSPDGQHIQHNALGGRTNHYRFDLNRDWLMLSQQENRAHAARFHAWNPHLLIDAHEMGPEEGYLMDPPRQPLNPAHPPHNLPWRQTFGFDQAAAFDRHGWSYYAKDWNVEFAPIYTSSWTNLAGGVGLLYEQAGVSAAAYRQATGQDLTYREAVHHQLVSTFANLETLRRQREKLLQTYLDDHREAVSSDVDFYQSFVMPPPADAARFRRFIEALKRQEVEFAFAEDAFRGEGLTSIYRERVASRDFPAGSLIVRPNQPQRRVMRALLEFENRADESFLLEEREELENHGGSRFYDVTAWNFPMTFGLESYWCDRISEVPTRDARTSSPATVDWDSRPQYGYLLDARSADIYAALWRLSQQGLQVRVATKPFQLSGRGHDAGTILLRNHEQRVAVGPVLQTCLEGLDVAVYPVDTASVGPRGPDLGGP